MTNLRSMLRSLYWRLLRTYRDVMAFPGLVYAGVYVGLKLNVVYHFLGIPAAGQVYLVPRQLRVSRRLMRQPYVVKVADIRWGGRPRGGPARVGAGLGRGLIFDGQWDIEDKQPIDAYLSRYIYSQTTLQMFRDGMPYSETAQYKEISKVVREGMFDDWRARGCRSEHDIKRYFEGLSTIFRSIESKGYASQEELGSSQWFDEIKIFIDRKGELHKQQGAGHHRLAMAGILGVERIPVLIIGIHREWALAAQREVGMDVITAMDRKIRRDIACG